MEYDVPDSGVSGRAEEVEARRHYAGRELTFPRPRVPFYDSTTYQDYKVLTQTPTTRLRVY